MISSPKISVVMPVYNAAPYLAESTGSILNQTFRDFEFIIVNDGSTDDTALILAKYEKSDARIRVYHQENQGTFAARNRGCRLARGKYIATMDADDVSFPDRLEKQMEYIEQHQDIGILGTWICNIDNNGSLRGTWCPPTNAKMLQWTLFFGVCVAAPTVLMRRDVIEKVNFYTSGTTGIEDVDLWLRASSITEFGNVPEVLLKYRVWEGNTSHTNRQNIRDSHVRLLTRFIREFLKLEPPIEAVAGLRRTRIGPPFESLRQILLTAGLIQKLYQTFVKENALALQERREISWDAARRVASLALQASRFHTSDSMLLFLQALKLDYRLLYPSTIMRGLERAFEQQLSTYSNNGFNS
jgi:glycosyltransferase involved in cell wall biosynthesis